MPPLNAVPENYFDYFGEIEERFSRRRGSILLLSTLDWALIETWREAGVPLEAVLRGIDNAFDGYEARAQRSRGRLRKVNGLAWCAQAVMAAAEEQVEASTGMAPEGRRTDPVESGFENTRIAAYLDRNAAALSAAIGVPNAALAGVLSSTAARLHELATELRGATPTALDDLDRTLTVLEARLLAALAAAASEAQLVTIREQSDSELAPVRSRLSAVQLRGIGEQFLHKRLLELHGLPRLSLFYMGHGE